MWGAFSHEWSKTHGSILEKYIYTHTHMHILIANTLPGLTLNSYLQN